MKKLLSFMLAFVMMATTSAGVFPLLEASAATAASISGLKATPDEVYEGDSVQVKGTVKSGSYYLRAIQINVRNEGDDDHGFTVGRVDFDFSKKKTSYNLNNLDEIDIGSYTCSGCGKKESLDGGKHRIDIHVGLYDSNGDVAEGFTKSVWIEVLEEETPCIKDIDATVDGTKVEFTVKTNLTAKYGIVLYADGYKLDMIDWDKDTGSSYIKYTGSHVFNQVGERRITAFALNEDGDSVSNSGVFVMVEIDSLGRVDPPSITTKDNQAIEAGNSFKVSWTKPGSPAGVTFMYNVYVWDGTNNTLVGEHLTTTSYTIPANKLSKTGTHVISVIAMATGYTQSDDDDASINLTVNEPQKTVVGYMYFMTSLLHRVEYADGSYEVEECQQGMCVCGRPYKVDHNAEKIPVEYMYFVASLLHRVEYADGSYEVEECQQGMCVCGRPYKVDHNAEKIPVEYVCLDHMQHLVVYANGTEATEDCTSGSCVCGRSNTAAEDPSLIDVEAIADGMTGYFTVKGNADAKYGIVLYADGYKLDMISWSKSGTSTVTYTGSHTFNQTGERTITVYALDENGVEVSDSKVTTTINMDSLGKSGTPMITTSDNQKIEVGSDFTISWKAPSTPAGVKFRYNVYLWDGKTDTLIGENLSTTSCIIAANKLGKVGTYTISVIAMATDYRQSEEASINLNVVEKKALGKVTLNTPRVSGSSKIQYGDDYTLSWDFDAQADYYQITIDGLTYKKIVNATEKSFAISGSVFKQYSGADTNYTISLVAMSHDTETYLPSEAATIRVHVAGYSESNALIKSAEILDGNEILAGTVVRFKIVTTKDVTALRMKDGVGSFIVNTWYASDIGTNSSNAQYYKDSGNERTWYIQQKVNHAGDANAAGAKRLLTFYSMVNEVEYNNCSVSFYCKKGDDVIGRFEITSPGNNAMLPSGKDIVITWSAPANTTVDYYIVDIYHGDVRIDRTTVTATTYTLSGSLLEKDSVAWQIRITSRKDEGQWAESVATASFKLECTHEHLGLPTDNILSYAQKNDTVHSCVVEKTYACLDCGLANAKKVQETVTKSHNWIALDKGGKVCNQCWHLQTDGSFTVKKDMQLSSLAGNREFVYFNVDASGNPANKQNGRYVDKSDKITILGEVGNCYLIEYPVTVNVRASGAFNWGFILKKLVNKKTNVQVSENMGVDFDTIRESVDHFFEYKKENSIGMGLSSPEYSLAQSIIGEKAPQDSALQAFLMYLNKDQFENIWDTIIIEATDGNYEVTKQTKAALYIILENLISDKQTNFTISEDDIDSVEEFSETVDLVYDSIGAVSDIADITFYEIKLNNPALWNSLNQLYFDIMNVERFPDNQKLSEAILAIDNAKEKFDNSEKWVVSFLSAIIKMIRISHIRNAMAQETLDVIEEAFTVRNGYDQEYSNAMLTAVQDVRIELNHSIYAGVSEFVKKLMLEIGDKTLEEAGKVIFSKLGFPSVVAAISIYDFVRSGILNITGLGDYITASTESFYIGFVGSVLDVSYLEYGVKYNNSGFSDADYIKFYALHNVMQGVQISLNEAAKTLSDSSYYDDRLDDEIEHLRKNTLANWEYNPYATGTLNKPDLSWISQSQNAYVYQLLLDEAYNRSYIFNYWDNMLLSEKELIIELVNDMKQLSESPFVTMYLLNTKEFESISNISDRNSILLVTSNGAGLLLESRAPNGWLANQLSFCVLSSEQITTMLSDKASNNILPKDVRFSPVYIQGFKDKTNYSCIIGAIENKEYITASLRLYVDNEDVNVLMDKCVPTSYQDNNGWLMKNILKAYEKIFGIRIRETKLSLIFEKLQVGEYKEYAWKDILEDK